MPLDNNAIETLSINAVKKLRFVLYFKKCEGKDKGKYEIYDFFKTEFCVAYDGKDGEKLPISQFFILHTNDFLTLNNIDFGFRVLKCDTSNMKEVFYRPDEVEQTIFDNYANNIKEDRTSEDLLFQVMLDLGILLSSKIEETTIAGCKVFNVADGFLYACFDNNISEEVVKAIATEQPYYAVFRDSGMASDSVLTNFDQIFASISPTTVRKVL